MKKKITINVILCSLLLVVISLVIAPFFAEAAIYVANQSTNSILIWPNNATGNVAPARIIQGAATNLNYPWGLAVDNSFIYVTNDRDASLASVTVYDINATGNTAPVRTIQGNLTTLNFPTGIAVDDNFIYVVNSNMASLSLQDRVDVYPKNANGNVAPVRRIEGSNTGLSTVPYGLAVDANFIYVGCVNSDSIRIFNVTDNGNVTPTRIIGGGATVLSSPYGLAVDGSFIYVADTQSRVTVYPSNGNGGIPPTRTIAGGNTSLYEPYGIAIDVNSMYVSDIEPRVVVFPLNANGDVFPSQNIEGSNTGLDNPTGIAVDSRNPFATDIPTLNQWSMIIFVILAGLGAVYFMRRKTAKS